ncbi:MAG: restriction endonuclease subunit S [Haemophilus parainfluenzae]|jgi:type I restriction enzyme S subunit|nr:restriction endonuclease subunit S [Haemophilus parainfluenzae]
MRRYESYKDSGVEWLGEVPSHWESFPLFVQAKISSITNHIDKELLSVYLDRGVVRFSDVDEKRTNVTSLDLSKYQLVRKGNLVLNNQQAWRGSVGVSSYEGIVSPAYLILELSNKFDPHYANYLFRNGSMVSHYLIASKGVGTIQRNLYWGNLRRTPIFIPPLSEQQKIAQFLDDKTAKIDQAVDLAEKQIALLKEHKQILIQNAVTRGLNPDVPLKDSCVEWIGQVPEHWICINLKFLCCVKGGYAFASEDFSAEGIPVIRISDILFDGSVDNINCKRIPPKLAPNQKDCQLKYGQCVMAMTGGTIGKVSVYKYKELAYVNQRVGKFEVVSSKLNYIFLYYLLNSFGYQEYIKLTAFGGAQPNISDTEMVDYQIALPSIEEQIMITNYLSKETTKIDQAIALKTAHIEKLKEYKSVLINDVVTGKVRV